jgi:hypothetical protein
MRKLIEGSLKITATAQGHVATFTPYALEDGPAQTRSLGTREAVAEFLQGIGTRTARLINAMDDLRETGTAYLPSVFLTRAQFLRFHV